MLGFGGHSPPSLSQRAAQQLKMVLFKDVEECHRVMLSELSLGVLLREMGSQ